MSASYLNQIPNLKKHKNRCCEGQIDRLLFPCLGHIKNARRVHRSAMRWRSYIYINVTSACRPSHPPLPFQLQPIICASEPRASEEPPTWTDWSLSLSLFDARSLAITCVGPEFILFCFGSGGDPHLSLSSLHRRQPPVQQLYRIWMARRRLCAETPGRRVFYPTSGSLGNRLSVCA